MRILFAAIQLGFSTLAVAQQPTQLPDSTYLHLTLELPVIGSFNYDSVSVQRRVSFQQTMKDVQVVGCSLSLKIQVQRSSRGADPRFARNFYETTLTIPLEAMDPKRLQGRVEVPSGNSRLEPPPWLLPIRVRANDKSSIVFSTSQTSRKTSTRAFDLRMKNEQAAHLLAEWLRDAGTRCKSWNTAPLRPIR